MLIVYDHGTGQMCNQMAIQMFILASAYHRGYHVIYYDFPRYEGPVYHCSELEAVFTEKKGKPRIRHAISKAIYKTCHILHIQNSRFINGYDQDCVNYALQTKSVINKTVYSFSWPFFDKEAVRAHAELLRQYFAPNDQINDYIGKMTYDIDKDSIKIGVHLRRGDYKTWHNGKFYYDDSVYKKYMDQIYCALNHVKVVFFLFSNEPINQQSFSSDDYKVVVSHGNGMQDLYLMSKCNYLIGPPSTYSGFASFMGNAPRYAIRDSQEDLSLDKMHIWLVETDWREYTDDELL